MCTSLNMYIYACVPYSEISLCVSHLKEVFPILTPGPDDDDEINQEDQNQRGHHGRLVHRRKLQEHVAEVNLVHRNMEGVGKRHLLHGFASAV